MSTGDTKALIEQAVNGLCQEVPSLRKLKLVVRLELRARGDSPTWRVEIPGPRVSKEPTSDARVEVSLARSHFNELAKDGRVKHWAEAHAHGHVQVSGEPAVVKLLGSVLQRHLARARS